MKAYLILEDGTVFTGRSVGAAADVICEIVFNTSMTGYLEVLTDPSYAGQGVVMTYPLIGNYGLTPDMESARAWPKAYIIRELSRIPSNFRCTGTIQEFLEQQGVTGIEGIDTRALTKLLREKGTMNGMVTVNPDYDLHTILPELKKYRVGNVVEEATCGEIYKAVFSGDGEEQHAVDAKNTEGGQKNARKVALLDLGEKQSIAASLVKRGCDVTVYPAYTPAETILADRPDGIMLSNGPGNPESCTDIIKEVKKLYDSNVPVFAICLGHQLMALATGARTYKLKYGHRGGNHPVKDLKTGRVYISSQNHGYAVDEKSVDKNIAREAFVNVNDGTNEGLKYLGKPIFTVQFHPEASPGPQDLNFLFDRFMDMMKGVQ